MAKYLKTRENAICYENLNYFLAWKLNNPWSSITFTFEKHFHKKCTFKVIEQNKEGLPNSEQLKLLQCM